MSTTTETPADDAGANAADAAFEAMASHANEAAGRILGKLGIEHHANDESKPDEAEAVHGAAEEAKEQESEQEQQNQSEDWRQGLTDNDRGIFEFSQLLNDPKTAPQALQALIEGLHDYHGKQSQIDIKSELARMFGVATGGETGQANTSTQAKPTLPEGKNFDTATAAELEQYTEDLSAWKARQVIAEMGLDKMRDTFAATQQEREAELAQRRASQQAQAAFEQHGKALQTDYPGLNVTPEMFAKAFAENPHLANDPHAAIVKTFPKEIRQALVNDATRAAPKAPAMGPATVGNPRRVVAGDPSEVMSPRQAAIQAMRMAGDG